MVDPHTAVGIEAAERHAGVSQAPIISLATAHPSKFPDAVEKAIDSRPHLPPHLADLMDRETKIHHVSKDPAAIADLVDQMKRQNHGA